MGGISSRGRCTAWELQPQKAVVSFIGSIGWISCAASSGTTSVAHRLFGLAFFLLFCLFWPVKMLAFPSSTIARGTRLFSTCRALQHDNPLVSD